MHDCCFVDPGHLRHVRGLDGHVNKDICWGFETGIGIGNDQKRNSGPWGEIEHVISDWMIRLLSFKKNLGDTLKDSWLDCKNRIQSFIIIQKLFA